MRWVGLVVMGKRIMLKRIWCGNLKERGHLEDLRVDRKMILLVKWALKEYNWKR
jgi:hypothetical protein